MYQIYRVFLLLTCTTQLCLYARSIKEATTILPRFLLSDVQQNHVFMENLNIGNDIPAASAFSFC